MQPGGRDDPNTLATTGNNLQPPYQTALTKSPTKTTNPSSVTTALPILNRGKAPEAEDNPTANGNQRLKVPSRWFNRDSTASVPRFRDIKSWVFDQTGRAGSAGGSGSESAVGGHSSWEGGSADSVTGIPKMPPKAKYARL